MKRLFIAFILMIAIPNSAWAKDVQLHCVNENTGATSPSGVINIKIQDDGTSINDGGSEWRKRTGTTFRGWRYKYVLEELAVDIVFRPELMEISRTLTLDGDKSYFFGVCFPISNPFQ